MNSQNKGWGFVSLNLMSISISNIFQKMFFYQQTGSLFGLYWHKWVKTYILLLLLWMLWTLFVFLSQSVVLSHLRWWRKVGPSISKVWATFSVLLQDMYFTMSSLKGNAYGTMQIYLIYIQKKSSLFLLNLLASHDFRACLLYGVTTVISLGEGVAKWELTSTVFSVGGC